MIKAVPSLIVIIFVWFLPESPRWLVANSRDAEALAFLTRFHGNGDSQNPVVALEWYEFRIQSHVRDLREISNRAEFKKSITIDGADKRYFHYCICPPRVLMRPMGS